MSTFAEFAMQDQEAVVAGFSELLAEIIQHKTSVKDPAALQMLTGLQASLIAKRTQAGDALQHLRTASRLGEFKHISAPQPDRQLLAANDAPEEAEEAPLPAHHHRTLSVHDLMALELKLES